MPYLTVSGAVQARQTYRFYCQLIADTDFDGVVDDTLLLDVVVLEPTRTAIETLIAGCGYLEDYTLISYWPPENYTPF
ncbi:MAG: hypothetical protein JO235_07500 [Chroococcidiopsidaceae cyanobacterium CP_BM_RX_35]|nr:hypothetical protein [Chroococcidiopsidaceae cyanobacterium CP_BM_RX_35]